MNAIPVFFSEMMVADAQSYSPSAGKPRLVVESWQALGVPIDIREPVPATEAELCLAHDAEFVRKVLSGEKDNGFGNRLPEVTCSLPYTTGAFISAAREALRNRQVAVAPVSGFHHACYAEAMMFCTFNGLVVAAQVLKTAGLVNKVGILDFDQHYGNGTVDIIETLQLEDWLLHYTAGAEYKHETQAEAFLRSIPERVWSFADCDILLYQAGADPHIKDPLGGWLKTAQLAERDSLVFESAKLVGLPVAWDLAGGYQSNIRDVLDIHDNTLHACGKTYL